ncbi:phage tail protein [Grimontia hollisae]|uniref:phage tail protein n=1 Tax=Grimontia hollisae TaxID=673 RepID=UPI0012AC98B5|nr:phage tail protein [Grimontia hollisae]
MSNFDALGQLVTEARNLLDSIKGGAIRTMQNSFDSLLGTINGEWAAKKAQVDSEALAAIGRVDTQTVINAMGFTAQNYNGDFIDTMELGENALGYKNVYPIGMGVGAGSNDCFKAEMINVTSGHDPVFRHPEAQALLDYMGIGKESRHFSYSFRILKLTVLDTSFLQNEGYDFYIPDQHVKTSPTATFMAYVKIKGGAVSRLGSDTGGSWKQIVTHFQSSKPGTYQHIDLSFAQDTAVGDELYLALPTICTGHFPRSIKHGLLNNQETAVIRKVGLQTEGGRYS